jgi:site-specific recombinase XerD
MQINYCIEEFRKYLLLIERSPETIKCYVKDLTHFRKFVEENSKSINPVLSLIKSEDIHNFLFYLLNEKHYAPNSRRRALNSLKSFYSYCVMRQFCSINITDKIGHVKVMQKERTFLSQVDVIKLVSSLNTPLLKTLVNTLYYTGLRISECTKLSIESVDTNNSIIYVRNGKGNKNRNIPISDKLKVILEAYISSTRVKEDSNKFFSTKSGGISPSYVNKSLRDATKTAGINKHVTAHVLRHSFASNLLRNGVDIVKIQRLLGHANLKTTCIYIHTSIEDLRGAVNVL